jgi:hypothetical protein
MYTHIYTYMITTSYMSSLIGFEIALFVLEAVIILIAAYFSYATVNVPGSLNEATNNLYCKLFIYTYICIYVNKYKYIYIYI